jgi:hypothetical protein
MKQNHYRCITCKSFLSEKTVDNNKSYVCNSCQSGLIPTFFLSKILSEYEFRKLNFEIQKSQVVSSAKCPLCHKSLSKIIDLLDNNILESCKDCEVTWIDAKTWAKIKAENLNFKNKPSLPSQSQDYKKQSEEDILDAVIDFAYLFDDES